jgi:hypothetical protein
VTDVDRERSGSATGVEVLQRYVTAATEATAALCNATLRAWGCLVSAAVKNYQSATGTPVRSSYQRGPERDAAPEARILAVRGNTATAAQDQTDDRGSQTTEDDAVVASDDTGGAEEAETTPGEAVHAADEAIATVTVNETVYAIRAGENAGTYAVTAPSGVPVGTVHRRRSSSGRSVTWEARTMDDLPIGARVHASRIKAATALAEHHRAHPDEVEDRS